MSDLLSKLPLIVLKIAQHIQVAQGKAVLVGGSVRDMLLGLPVSDFDLEIYHIADLSELKKVLQSFGYPNEVGKNFAVLKLKIDGLNLDFSLPRLDIKTGAKHTDFQVIADPNLDFATAASRRDFTINSLGLDLSTGQILDPFCGQKDLAARVLRHVGPAFTEDPLRVLRAMQFAARFNLTIAPQTLQLCRTIDLTDLPAERLFEEFKKLLLQAQKPSLGLNYLWDLGAIQLFPELKALKNVPQDPKWHPEGDVWIHTLLCVDAMAALLQKSTVSTTKKLIMLLAALCHDLGKPATTQELNNKITSYGHDQKGAAVTDSFLKRLTYDKKIIQEVKKLVQYHMQPTQLYTSNQKQTVSASAIRRLALKINIRDLILLATADFLGKGILGQSKKDFLAGQWLLSQAKALKLSNKKPTPILTGKKLLAFGFAPGPELGEIIQAAFQLQLDGKITCLKDALNWLNPDIFYLNAALKEAQKAASKNEVPIGAVIVHNHKIIARAHNLKETCQDVTAHAEILAIKKAQKKLADWRLTDCVLYCTLEPCSMCAGAIEQARISRVVFGAQDLKNPANPVLQSSFVPRAACEQILKTFFKKKRVKNA